MGEDDKTLVVRPIGGLCNRLRAVGSAWVLGRWQGRRVQVLWYANAELGARWRDLFEPAEGLSVVELDARGPASLPARLRHAYAALPGSPLAPLAALLRRRRFDRAFLPEECRRRAEARTGYRDSAACQHLFFIHYDWLVDTARAFPFLTPQAALRARIEAEAARLGPCPVGVHIRRTDSALAIRHSPIEGFERRMEDLLQTEPRTRFYLATDDPAVDARIRAGFGERVTSLARRYDRAGLDGIRDAVVDLWVLSRTHRVLGSYDSSFSETAATIGGIPLEIVTVPPAG